MEEKKIDKGSVVGFLLIGAILIWMLYTQKPDPSIEKQNITTTQQTTKKSAPDTNDNITQNSDNLIDNTDKTQVSSTIINFENELLDIKINSKGGEIIEARLKNYKKFDSLPVYLVKDNNTKLNLSFQTKDGRIINSRNLYFKYSITENNNNKILSLKASIGKGSLEFKYVLKSKEYLFDFNISSTGLSNIVSNVPQLEWQQKAFRRAKSATYENRYTMATYRYEDGNVNELSASSDDDEQEKDVQWISFRQHFFNTILVADTPFSSANIMSKNLVQSNDENPLFTKDFLVKLPIELQNGDFQKQLHWYYGPTDYKILKNYDDKHHELSKSLYLGWGIFGWINKYIFIPLFNILCSVLPHGVAIILLTILVRLVMSPATYKSYLSQAKMKVLQPEIKEINDKYKGKEKAMKRQKETMTLYRKAGVNPMSGCIPSLLQLPVFYALFTFFPTAFALRQKSFLWAEDLSSYDTIFKLPFSIPFYGSHVSLFPLLASIAIFFYMRMTMGQNLAQQQQQPGMPNMKFLMYLSPLMMLFFFNNYASGLSLYYFISNLITILIMLVIKNVIIDQDKIHARIEENKKQPKKENRFQQKMKSVMEKAEAQREVQEKAKKRK